MPHSRRYNKLQSRIKAIERHLLPAIKVSGNYTNKESDQIRSYVMLVHAEIESYFEDVSKDKARNSLNLWSNTRQKSNCLLSIMAFCTVELGWDKIQNENDKNSLSYRINRTVNHYIESLEDNHGVKTKNIKKMLLPLGVEDTEFDQTWLIVMDNFGRDRGELAHTTHSVQYQIDPQTEKTRVNFHIMREIERLDNIIRGLK